MTIRGARCIVATSVDRINDAKVKRRFIHTSVSGDSEAKAAKKLAVTESLMFNESNLRDDPKTPIARADINLIFSTDGVVCEDVGGVTHQGVQSRIYQGRVWYNEHQAVLYALLAHKPQQPVSIPRVEESVVKAAN